jgi:signal transduction histidine kinase/ActR/RegA family two-component response regulator
VFARLVLLVIGVSVLIGLVAVFIDMRLRAAHRLDMLEERAAVAAKMIDSRLAESLDVLRFCATSPHLVSAVDLSAFADECGRAHDVAGGWVVLIEVGETHRQIVNSRLPADGQLPPPYPRSEERETLLALEARSRADGGPAISDAFFGRALDAPVMAVGQFVTLADGRETMLYSGIEAATLSRLLEVFAGAGHDQWEGKGFLGLVDGSLRAVARSEDSDARLGMHAPSWFAALTAARSGSAANVSGPHPDDPRLDIGFRQLETATGWVAFAGAWRSANPLEDYTMASWPSALALAAGLFAVGAQCLWWRQELLEAQLKANEKEREAAVIAERERSRVMAATAHEIRGPVVALLGALELGRSAIRPDLYASATRAGEGVLRLVTELLEVSRIGARKTTFHPAPTDLAAAIRDVVARHENAAAAKGLELTVKTPDAPLPLVNVDQLRFEQIVENLVSNAVKFTARGFVRVVLLGARADGNSVDVILTVSDTGPGVPLFMQEKIFEEFSRFESNTAERKAGVGLGLAIARGLARAMGGDISFVSRAAGGSVFRVSMRLPVAPVARNLAGGESQGLLEGLRIVLAEDDPIIREITARRLRIAGAEVFEAEDGATAVSKISRFRPDVALLDLEMSILDGIGAVLRLRNNPALGGLLVFGLTAYGVGPKIAAARAAGMDEVLIKPLQLEVLAQKVRTALGDRDLGKKRDAASQEPRV